MPPRWVTYGVTAILLSPSLTLAAACPALTHTLSLGSRDTATAPRGQVSELQRFLSSYYGLNAADYVTGYFGALTRANVRRFQCDQLKICAGSEAANGWGVVGAKTRAAIARACTPVVAQSTVAAPTPQCLNPARPTLSCDGSWQLFRDSNGCHTGWTCVVNQVPTSAATTTPANRPPLISAIVGPTLLKPNESGTWSITASDPEAEVLTFSAVWGDEGANIATLLNISQQGTPYSATTTLTHAYAQTGAYTLVVFAKDAGGNVVKATLSITVHDPAPPSPVASPPSAPPPPSPSPSPTPIPIPIPTPSPSPTANTHVWLSVSPASGAAPLSVTVSYKRYKPGFYICAAYTITWGDGTVEHLPETQECGAPIPPPATHSHTYSQSGTYRISIAVDPPYSRTYEPAEVWVTVN